MQEVSSLSDASERAIYATIGHFAGLGRNHDRAVSFTYPRRIGTDREHIGTGLNSHLTGFANAVVLDDSAHFEIVGDDQPFKTEPAAQESGDKALT